MHAFLFSQFFFCSPPLVTPSVNPSPFSTFTISISPDISDSLFYISAQFSPECTVKRIDFVKQVPGTYCVMDAGRSVREITAFGKQKQVLQLNRTGHNTWTAPEPIDSLHYSVLESIQGPDEDSLFNPVYSGATVAKDHALINPYMVCCFSKHHLLKPAVITIHCPPDWSIATMLPQDSSGRFYAENFMQLFDSPILTGKLSHGAFRYRKRTFHIYTYHPGPKSLISDLLPLLRAAVRDMHAFSDFLPTPAYAFFITYNKEHVNRIGALEHNTSSCYWFPEENSKKAATYLPFIARHELFHTLIPLSLKGNRVSTFDYTSLNPVEHLWFYEGITEWAVFKMMLTEGSISTKDFILEFREKLLRALYDTPDSSLMLLSTLTVESNAAQRSLMPFYSKGMVLATLLDIEIRDQTNGKTGLMDVLTRMHKAYPASSHFFDSDLFTIISRFSSPGIHQFLTDYVQENKSLPVETTFRKIGIRYFPSRQNPYVQTDPGLLLKADNTTGRLIIKGIHPLVTQFGFQKDDTLQTFNGKEITKSNLDTLLGPLETLAPGTPYKMKVVRKNEELTISATTIFATVNHTFETGAPLSPRQRMLYTAWKTR